jgi:hypothetical protein
MDFYRLAINDLTEAGMQPFVKDKEMLICNGEIYNHEIFRHGEEKGVRVIVRFFPIYQRLWYHEDYGYHQRRLCIRVDEW